MTKQKTLKTVLSVLAVLVVFVLAFGLTTRLLEPKYATDLVEGSFLRQYYKESGNHDVIFVGDCEVYANFSPMELFRQYGITSYIRGSSQQLIWQSYYILEETLQYETPKIVIYNVNAMRYSEPVSEEYNRLTIDKMKWSAQKVGIIQASMTEEETFWSYVFPILRYHSRFDKLTSEDLTYFFGGRENSYFGYQLHTGVVPVEHLPAKRPLPNYQFGDICYSYLDKMTQLCKEKGVELILIKAPSVYPYWYDEYDAQIQAYADANGLITIPSVRAGGTVDDAIFDMAVAFGAPCTKQGPPKNGERVYGINFLSRVADLYPEAKPYDFTPHAKFLR